MKRFLILALQHQRRRIAALKRENERLQKLNHQRADDISFLMQLGRSRPFPSKRARSGDASMTR
jgi:cell division protein FtsB